MRAAAVALVFGLAATGCPEQSDPAPTKATRSEDTRDETVLQFHKGGQLQYGKWYEAPNANSACRWSVEWKRVGDDAPATTQESGDNTDRVRVRAETPGKDVFLRFNRACGQFQESP